MDNLSLAQRKNANFKRFNFRPRTSWPIGLPIIAFDEDFVVAGFDCPETQPIFTWPAPPSGKTWLDLFVTYYPDLSLLELARIQRLNFEPFFSFENLLKAIHLRSSENLFSSLNLILLLPDSLQDFISDKKFSVQELQILNTIPFELALESLEFVKMQQLGRMQAAQVIEWLIELKMSATDKINFNDFIGHNAESTFQLVFAARHKNTVEADQQRHKNLNLTWPSGVKADFQRRGDRSGFECKLFVSNPIELKKNLLSLDKVVQEWKE